MASILLVDDDLSIRTVVSLMLARAGHVVTVAGGGEEAFALATQNPPEVVLSDLCMSGMNGDEFLRNIIQHLPGTSCILMTGDNDHLDEGAETPWSLLRKPFSCQALSETIDAALGAVK